MSHHFPRLYQFSRSQSMVFYLREIHELQNTRPIGGGEVCTGLYIPGRAYYWLNLMWLRKVIEGPAASDFSQTREILVRKYLNKWKQFIITTKKIILASPR